MSGLASQQAGAAPGPIAPGRPAAQLTRNPREAVLRFSFLTVLVRPARADAAARFCTEPLPAGALPQASRPAVAHPCTSPN